MTSPFPRARVLAPALVLAALVLPALAACSSSTAAVPATSTTSPQVAGPSVPAAAPGVATGSHLPPQEFQAAMAAPGTVVLDVRTPAEFAAGHLPGAVNVDIEASDFGQRISELDKGTTYAVYCRTGRRSGLALDEMTRTGFGSVYDLDGGIVAWQEAGGQLVTG